MALKESLDCVFLGDELKFVSKTAESVRSLNRFTSLASWIKHLDRKTVFLYNRLLFPGN